MNWLEKFKENYNGLSEEAREVEPFVKENYKGNAYIPWATMERLTYMQDADAVFNIIETADGSIVHTDKVLNYQKNTQKGEVISETESTMFSHTVRVSCTFLGKTFVEDYPIQDTDYSAARVINQNLVNKALQRAKAKVASRATGIGYKLYEGKDLQFDEPKEEVKKPVLPKKETKKVEKVEKVELTKEQKVANIMDGGETSAFLNGERTFVPQEVVITTASDATEDFLGENNNEGKRIVDANSEVSEEVKELYTILTTTPTEKITPLLQRLNISIVKKYGFALNTTDSIDVFNDKASKLTDIAKFTRSVKSLLGE